MKMQVGDLLDKKKRGAKIVMLTCYDYPTAVLENACGVDVLLVGDSVGTNVLGYGDVTEVTMEDMLHHVRAVARGTVRSFLLGDMPFRSFDTVESAQRNAARMVEGGADGIKMEGESEVIEQLQRVASAGIPVCAHIGYTPQTDGERPSVQGKDAERAIELLEIACRLEDAGAAMMVLELIPERLSAEISARLTIPTIGIGAGRFCDGQVQVVQDILGLSPRVFRHAKAYGEASQLFTKVLKSYAEEVRNGAFPEEKNASRLPDEVIDAVKRWCEQNPAETCRAAGKAGS